MPVDGAVGYLDGEDGRPATAALATSVRAGPGLAGAADLRCAALPRAAGDSQNLCHPVIRVAVPTRSAHDGYLVDSASSHMLVLKIKPCMSKYKQLYSETANGSLNQLSFI